MIAVRLMGGLGNQLFQLGLALRLSASVPVCLDASRLGTAPGGGTPRPYALGGYAHGIPLASRFDRWRIGWDIPLLGRIGRRLDRALPWQRRRWLVERHPFSYDEAVLGVDRGVLIGYWQHVDYLPRETMAGILGISATGLPPAAPQREADQAIAVHVRRGDLADNARVRDYHGLCGKTYFTAAMDQARRRLPGARFTIFSDDPTWCTAELAGADADVASPGGTAQEDLARMLRFRHFILSNSTLGWWAAWLGSGPESLVIAPTPWVRMEPAADASLILPHWLRMPA